MGIYYMVFPIYSFMLTLSSSSFPIAISQLVSKSIAEQNYKKATSIFKVSLFILSVLGLVTTLIIFALAKPISALQGQIKANFAYYIIAPSIFIVSLLSAFRGYFQGLQNMMPSAVSQIIEQITKLICGLLFSTQLVKYGVVYGVVGALLAITLSECFALGYLSIYYTVFKKHNKAFYIAKLPTRQNFFDLTKTILKQVLPYMMSTIIYPLAVLIDSFLIVNLLVNSGFSNNTATILYGINSGVVGALTNLPTVVSVSLAIAIIPSISRAYRDKQTKEVSLKANFCIKICLLIALPCAICFILFSRPIVDVLFGRGLNNNIFNQSAVAYGLLSVAGIGVVYLCLMQVCTAILQSIDRPYLPVISLSLAVVIKIVVESVLLLQPTINIYGAVISNIACYFVASIIDLYLVKKHIKIKFNFVHMFILPLCAMLIMIGVIFGFMMLFNTFMSYTLTTIFAFMLGAISYIVCLFWFGVFDKSELGFFKKINFIKK